MKSIEDQTGSISSLSSKSSFKQDPLIQIAADFLCYFVFYNFYMLKKLNTKSSYHKQLDCQRLESKNKRNASIHTLITSRSALSLKVHNYPETKRIHKKSQSKIIKQREVKFLTEQMKQSMDYDSPPLKKTASQNFLKHSSIQIDHYNNAYQLVAYSFKKNKKLNGLQKQQQQQEIANKIQKPTFKLQNISKVKIRQHKRHKSHSINQIQLQSKQKLLKCQGKLPKCASNKDPFIRTITLKDSEMTAGKKQDINQQIQNIQCSYYFESEEQHIGNSEKQSNNQFVNDFHQKKRGKFLLYDSDGSIWKEKNLKNILRSTLDLLN